MTRIFQRIALLVALLAMPPEVSAHRLDEYLQATIVSIEPDNIRLQINLTPGVEVANRVIALIDHNADSVISSKEAEAYAESYKNDLTVRLDKQKLKLKLASSHFPTPAEIRTGLGIIQVEFSAKPGQLTSGSHKLSIENKHLRAISVYLLNAARPKSAQIQIAAQHRNDTQSEGAIEFTFQQPPNPSKRAGISHEQRI